MQASTFTQRATPFQGTAQTALRSNARSSRRSAMRMPPRAALEGADVFAVTQQAIAFAAVVGAEAAYTGLNTKADVPGRPSVLNTLAGVGGTVLATALLQSGDAIGQAGCGVGFATSVFLLIQYSLRVKDTPYDPLDWPGAKTWPAVMCLISFFALSAFGQGFLDGAGMLSK